jgi:hypothetical protein
VLVSADQAGAVGQHKQSYGITKPGTSRVDTAALRAGGRARSSRNNNEVHSETRRHARRRTHSLCSLLSSTAPPPLPPST